MTIWQRLRKVLCSPEWDRLADAIAEAEIELDRQDRPATQGGNSESATPWAQAASRFLAKAKEHLKNRQRDSGWASVLAAQRAIIANSNEPGRIDRVATALRREVEKVGGWRAKAIEDLICAPDGKLRPDLNVVSVVDALAIRDEFFATNYFKIRLRRRHLVHLAALIWVSIALCLGLSVWGVLPTPLDAWELLATVILFGILGAAVSVGQSLTAADLSAKVPAQQIGAFVVWMRPGIGAAAAIVSLVLLYANEQLKLLDYTTFNPSKTAVVILVAFVAGFSERFIVGAIERVSKQVDAKPGSS